MPSLVRSPTKNPAIRSRHRIISPPRASTLILVGVVSLVRRRSVERRPETGARRLRPCATCLTILEKSHA